MLQPSRFRGSFASSARITADIEAMSKALARSERCEYADLFRIILPMNRRNFLKESIVAGAGFHLYGVSVAFASNVVEPAGEPGVMALPVDTDRFTTSIDQQIYGQFLEHINHSVEDGLFAEQIRGAGFESEEDRKSTRL